MSEEAPPSSTVGENDARDDDLRQQVEGLQQQLFQLRQEMNELRQAGEERRVGDLSLGAASAPVNPDDYLGDKVAHATPAQTSQAGFFPATQSTDTRPAPSVPPEFNELMDRIERVEQRIRNTPQYRDVFWAKVSGNVASNGTCAFKEQFNNSSGIVAFPGGRSANGAANMTEVNGRGGASNGTVVLAQSYQNANTTQYSYITIGGSAIPVNLTKTSGSDGAVSTPVSWVYTATEDNGTTHTGLSPSHNRMSAKTMPGTKGALWQHSNGTLELFHTDELPNFGTC